MRNFITSRTFPYDIVKDKIKRKPLRSSTNRIISINYNCITKSQLNESVIE